MNAQLVFRRQGRGLVPVGEAAAAALSKIAEGRDVLVKVHAARNPRQHRLWWALMAKIVEIQPERWPTPEALCQSMKLALGHYDQVELPNGKVVMAPKSISFASMAQGEFDLLFSAAMDLIERYIVPGIDRIELANEIVEMIGERRARAA